MACGRLAEPALVQCARVTLPETQFVPQQSRQLQAFACDAADVRHPGLGLVLRNPWEQCAATGVTLDLSEAADSWPIAFGVAYDRAPRTGAGRLGPDSVRCSFDMESWVPFGRAQRALAAGGPGHPALRCYCFQRSVAEGQSELCQSFAEEEAGRAGAVFLMCVLCALALALLEWLVKLTVGWVAPLSATDRDAAVVRHLLPGGAAAVVLGLVLTSASIPGALGGVLADTGMDWYRHVGEALALGLLLASLLPVAFFVRGVVRTRHRRVLATLYGYTHREKVAWFENMEFPLASRYSAMALTAGVAAVCAGAQPLCWWLGAGYMACSYWCDKWLLLRASRRAPHTDANVSLAVSRTLVWLTLLHALASCWALSYQPLFPSPDGVALAERTEQAWLADAWALYPFAERVGGFTSAAAQPNFIVFLLATAVLFVQKLLDLGVSSPAAAGILSAVVPCYMRLLRRIKFISLAGETTAEDWETALQVMQKYATITSYDYQRQRRYGGKPGQVVSDQSSTEDEASVADLSATSAST